jgi:hypothetical protein
MAPTLDAAVEHYDQLFNLSHRAAQKRDLDAYLTML